MTIADALDFEPPMDPGLLADLDAAITAGAGAEARTLCAWLAAVLPRQEITRGGRPYLDRYLVHSYGRRGGRLLLHHFHASDEPGLLHSHPWEESRSAILAGGYREHRRGGAPVELRPGAANTLRAEDFHRVELLEADAWTLFSTGAPCTTWWFMDEATGRRTHHTRQER